ncbi:hypothetical protein D3C76_831220 [compost metagenome]
MTGATAPRCGTRLALGRQPLICRRCVGAQRRLSGKILRQRRDLVVAQCGGQWLHLRTVPFALCKCLELCLEVAGLLPREGWVLLVL